MSQVVKNRLNNLKKSKFRNSFHLRKKEIEYINNKDIEEIRKQAYEIINKRIKPEIIENDGKQTPMKNHPVFIAQHATATCCRGCMEKWHHIKKNKELTEHEIDFIVELIMEWIKEEYKNVKDH